MQFKNSSGKFITKSLFFELTLAKRPYAVYTLKDEDHTDPKGKVFISLKRLFLDCDDPTEYKFATTHLGGWSHWKEMQTVDELLKHIVEWREERDVKLRSLGVRKMVESAEQGNYQAAKFLTDRGWDTASKGRPSKEAIKKAAKEEAGIRSNISNDLERLRRARGN